MSYPSSLMPTGGSEGMNLEVWFLQPNEVSIFLESSFADPDDERLYETMMFALFAARHLANGRGKFNYASLAEVLFSLDEHEPLPEVVEHLDDAGKVRLVSPTSGGGRKGFTCTLRPEKRSFFKLHPHGFGMLGKGVDYYAPTSTLALLAWLLSRRQDDDRYQLALGTTAKMIGAAGVSGQIGVTSQAQVAMQAASAGWMHPDDLIPAGQEVSDEVRELCAEHDIEFGSLYAEARRQLAEASEWSGKETLLRDEAGVRRLCGILVAKSAGLGGDAPLLLNIASQLSTSLLRMGDDQNLQGAYGLLDHQLETTIEEAGLTPVVEALEEMIMGEASLDQSETEAEAPGQELPYGPGGRMGYDLAQLREVFGEEAESIYRGLTVAYADHDLSDALELVLDVRDRSLRGVPMEGLEQRIADAMRNPPGRGDREETLDDLAEAPVARLREDYRTSMRSYAAGTLIRIHDRLSDGRMLVGVFDLDSTVFPVPEHLIEPVE